MATSGERCYQEHNYRGMSIELSNERWAYYRHPIHCSVLIVLLYLLVKVDLSPQIKAVNMFLYKGTKTTRSIVIKDY